MPYTCYIYSRFTIYPSLILKFIVCFTQLEILKPDFFVMNVNAWNAYNYGKQILPIYIITATSYMFKTATYKTNIHFICTTFYLTWTSNLISSYEKATSVS